MKHIKIACLSLLLIAKAGIATAQTKADIPEQSSPTRSLSRKCPNCDGSGRVLVSCEMKLHIRPYKESK